MKFKDLSSSGKDFLRLKAGETVRGVFKGDPYDFRQHWVNNRSVVCEGRTKCELCLEGEKSAFRFKINFIVQGNGAFIAKVFEQGKSVYEALRVLNADYPLDKHLVKITRHGSGTDTNYAILPVPNGMITKEQEKAIKAIRLNDLMPQLDSTDEVEEENEDEDTDN